MRLIRTRWLLLALISSALLWGALVLWCPRARQMRFFYVEACELFSDYAMPRSCSLCDDPYAAADVEPQDRCYAMLGYLIASAFPTDTISGGLAFTATGALLFLLALSIFISADRRCDWWTLPAFILSAPFLYNLERANQIWLAGAGALVFLAWYEADSRWKRLAALAALAFASALKITPGVFSLLLLKERRWRDFLTFAVLGAALTVVPFACRGGLGLIFEWIDRMREHTAYYRLGKTWGTATLCWAPLRILGRFVGHVPSVGGFCQLADTVLGGMCLWGFFKTSDRRNEVFLLAAGAVILPSVSQYYTIIYFLPALALSARERLSRLEAALWFVVLTPLYPFVWKYSLNPSLADGALMALIVSTCWRVLVRPSAPEDSQS